MTTATNTSKSNNNSTTVDNTDMGGENLSLDSNVDILFDRAMNNLTSA